MSVSLRVVTLLVPLTLVLSSCVGSSSGAAALQATALSESSPVMLAAPAPTATSTPQPTSVPPVAKGVRVAGVDVGGLTAEEARKKLNDSLVSLLRPLDLQAGEQHFTLRPEDIGFQLPLDELIAQALAAKEGARIALKISYDEPLLRTMLTKLVTHSDTTAAISVITDTETISRSFVVSGGGQLDLDTAVQRVDERLRSIGSSRRVTLLFNAGPAHPSPEQLQRQIEEMAKEWDGIVGMYVYDLTHDRVVASLNEQTVFSGASVMKVPILLQSYVHLPKFTSEQETWLRKMVVESDNIAANNMLAASVEGAGTDDALQGALDMSEMLRGLGLKHTYQNMPYEAKDYLINLRKIKIKFGPEREGAAPYTPADRVLRTTPAEMSQVFLLIEQCRQGKGLLLERFPDTLTPARCGEMLERLKLNADRSRMVAGLPADAAVAHKSGWIDDMQADVGIVRSPGGDFLVAIYVYTEIIPNKTYLTDEVAAPVIAGFAHLVYTYFNPVSVAALQ